MSNPNNDNGDFPIRKIVEWTATILGLVFSSIIIAYFKDTGDRLDNHTERMAIMNTNQQHLSKNIDAIYQKIETLPTAAEFKREFQQMVEIKDKLSSLEKEVQTVTTEVYELKYRLRLTPPQN